MTIKELTDILELNNIPNDVILWSDSGWEADKTEVECIFYDQENNYIIFTQELNNYINNKKYIKLNGERK